MDSASQNSGAELRNELRSDASTITDTAKQRLQSEVDSRKSTAATQAKSVSSALESAADQLNDSPAWLRSAFQQGAQTLQRFADQVEQKDSRELTRDVQQLARQNPGTFLAGCAAIGFAAARVLKAGAEQTSQGQGDYGQGDYAQSSYSYDQQPATAGAYDPYAAQPASGSSPMFGGASGTQTGYSTQGGAL
jgi:hypothetical protein